jgi:hypothetical protein
VAFVKTVSLVVVMLDLEPTLMESSGIESLKRRYTYQYLLLSLFQSQTDRKIKVEFEEKEVFFPRME